MNKISSQDVQALLKTAAMTVRVQDEEIVSLREKVASFEKKDRMVKIAREMEEKGLHAELNFDEKLAHLREAQDLSITEEAVKMASPQHGVLGSVSDKPGSGGLHPFEQYLSTGEVEE
jgi:hypothetical protein